MNEQNSLYQCVVNGECTATLFTTDSCPYCPELKHKLNEIKLPFTEKKVDDEIAEKYNITHVPVLHISKEDEIDSIIIENVALEKIKKKLGI